MLSPNIYTPKKYLMKTILDNMIFYEINRGEIDINNIDVKNPIVTNSNIDEFARSYNVIYSTDNVKGILRNAMDLCNKNLISQNPYMYILDLDGRDLSLTEHDKIIIEITENVAKGDLTDYNEDYVLKNWIKPREKELIEIANAYNEWFKSIKHKRT